MKYIVFLTSILLSSASFSMEPETTGPDGSHTISITLPPLDSAEFSMSPEATGPEGSHTISITLPIFDGSSEENKGVVYDYKPLKKLLHLKETYFTENEEGLWIPKSLPYADLCKAMGLLCESIVFYRYDNELGAMLARLCFQLARTPGQERCLIDGLNTMSTAIVHEIYDHEYNDCKENTKFHIYFKEYTNELRSISIQRKNVRLKPLDRFIQEIHKFLTLPSDRPSIRNNRQGISPEQKFITNCHDLILLVHKEATPSFPHFDALFLSFRKILEANKGEEGLKLFSCLTKSLYESLQPNCPPSLLCAYAEKYLLPLKSYEPAFQSCKNIFFEEGSETNIVPPSDYGLRAHEYNLFGGILQYNGKYKEASQAFEYALSLKRNPEQQFAMQWNLATVKCVLEEQPNDDTLNVLERIYSFSPAERIEHNVTLPYKILEFTYAWASEKAGKSDRLEALLLAKQAKALEKALERRDQHAQRIRSAQRQMSPTTATNVPAPQRQKNRPQRPLVSPSVEGNSFNAEASSGPEKYVAPQVRVKTKKKGTPDPKRAVTQTTKVTPALPPRQLLHIEDLTTNGNAHETFYKLFAKYRNDVRSDKKVKISVYEIRSLFKALKQDFNPRAGKGSHKKGTLNFQEVGSEMDEQMVTLTKAIYLKSYQIKKLRLAFIKAGVIPDDTPIEQKLRENFPNEFPQ